MNHEDTKGTKRDEGENKEIVRRYFDAANTGDLDALDDLLAPDVIDHSAYAGQPAGRNGFKAFIAMWRTAFPDLVYTISSWSAGRVRERTAAGIITLRRRENALR